MSPVDVPPPAEHHAKIDAVAQAKKDAMDAFYKDLISTPRKDNSKMTRVSDLGQISEMTLPQDWKLGTTDSGSGGTFREYHPAGRPEVKICFYYRGQRIGEEEGAAFKAVLDKPAHVLSKAEIQSLTEVMRNKHDPKVFHMMGAHTEDLNGKRVLVVEGRFVEKQYDTRSIYVDSDGTGTAVQEIYFQAPKADYMMTVKQAQDAFRSIKWK